MEEELEETTESEKYIIKIDNDVFIADDFGYEFTQFDGDGAGRSDDMTMTRDVKGLNNKLYAKFNNKDRWYGLELSRLLKLIDKKECSLYYFDPKEYEWCTKSMYLTMSKVSTRLINNEIYIKDDIEVHFIQMDVDAI